jgi:hypothetical protein
MISETCGQEVRVYCDVSEMCAMQGAAAGLAEMNHGRTPYSGERATGRGR